ncbi:MAG: uroporphyrinogen-III synthase [Alphaproteobacteria bacterium]
MRVLLTRPLADSQRFATRLQRDGVDTVLAPLLHIEPVTQERPDFEGVQAVLLTSANGAHALAGLTDRRDFNILAVGPSTAAQANVEGFSDVAAAGGDVAKLADLARKRLVPSAGPLLHVAGSVQAGDLSGLLGQHGFQVERQVAYRAVMAESLPDTATAALENSALDGVVFFSPRTAAIFATLISKAGLAKTTAPLVAYCLSHAVADAVGSLGWHAQRVPQEPEGELLARLICSSLEMS